MAAQFLPAQSDRAPSHLKLVRADESRDEIELASNGQVVAVLEIWSMAEVERLPVEHRPQGRLSRHGRFVAVMRPIDV